MKPKDIELCYEMTGVNILSLLDTNGVKDLQRVDPKLYRWLVWWKRKQDGKKVDFSEMEDENLDLVEIRDAIRTFFGLGKPAEK